MAWGKGRGKVTKPKKLSAIKQYQKELDVIMGKSDFVCELSEQTQTMVDIGLMSGLKFDTQATIIKDTKLKSDKIYHIDNQSPSGISKVKRVSASTVSVVVEVEIALFTGATSFTKHVKTVNSFDTFEGFDWSFVQKALGDSKGKIITWDFMEDKINRLGSFSSMMPFYQSKRSFSSLGFAKRKEVGTIAVTVYTTG